MLHHRRADAVLRGVLNLGQRERYGVGDIRRDVKGDDDQAAEGKWKSNSVGSGTGEAD